MINEALFEQWFNYLIKINFKNVWSRQKIYIYIQYVIHKIPGVVSLGVGGVGSVRMNNFIKKWVKNFRFPQKWVWKSKNVT